MIWRYNIKKKLRLKKKYVVLLLVIFLVLSLFSIINIITWGSNNVSIDREIEEIESLVDVREVIDTDDVVVVNPPEDIDLDNPYFDYINMNLIDVSIDELKDINNDTVGWIKVNGTNINYPFVKYSDNKYYLTRDFKKKYNKAGWVFMDYRNNLYDKNTILYAHGRVDKTMFGSLKDVLEDAWFNDNLNHVVRISSEKSNSLWQVFSVYEIELTSDYLQVEFDSNSNYLSFLNSLKDRSKYDFGTQLNELDKIITLSTCSKNDGRIVLHAKLIKMEEK